MMIYYPIMYNTSYAMNIKQLKRKVTSLIRCICNDFCFNYWNKTFVAFTSKIYIINERRNHCHLYINLSSYNELFITIYKPRGIKGKTYNKHHDENNRIVCKNIILKLGAIRSLIRKDW